MTGQGTCLHVRPYLDSSEITAARRRELDIPRDVAAALGRSAVEAAVSGFYFNQAAEKVDWSRLVQAACSSKRSIPPETPLPNLERTAFPETQVQVTNETTLGASLRVVENGLRPLALNFANGIQPGGGFLTGARAQEEVLCRSSALYRTLVNDPMYEAHRKRPRQDSTDWGDLFTRRSGVSERRRNDAGPALVDQLYYLRGACGIQDRPTGIPRLVAKADSPGPLDRESFRLCGIRPRRVGLWRFLEIVFAIAEWSPERKFPGPFRDVFS